MSNPVYTCILNICDLYTNSLLVFFKRIIRSHTIKKFKVLLSNSNNFNGFLYCYLKVIILFNILLHTAKWF